MAMTKQLVLCLFLYIPILLMMLTIHRAAAFSSFQRTARDFCLDGHTGRRCLFVSVASRQYYRDHQQQQQHRLLASSVTGTAYTSNDPDAPVVTLFTKEGCTLCDKVKDILAHVRSTAPHSLQLQDITDNDAKHWYDRYKYDIPVLHVNGQYWIKHRITEQQAIEGLMACRDGRFVSPKGEPNASQMERS